MERSCIPATRLVSWTEDQILVVSVLDLEQLLPYGVPAPGDLPQRTGGHAGQQKFLAFQRTEVEFDQTGQLFQRSGAKNRKKKYLCQKF